MNNCLWKLLFNKSRLILIGIENFNREYDGKYLLAKKLSSEGFKVILAHKSFIQSIVKYFPIKEQIYIDKDARNHSGPRYAKSKKAGLNIFCLDEEALLRIKSDQFLKTSHQPISVNSIDRNFLLG